VDRLDPDGVPVVIVDADAVRRWTGPAGPADAGEVGVLRPASDRVTRLRVSHWAVRSARGTG
jgi:hypothetical protein